MMFQRFKRISYLLFVMILTACQTTQIDQTKEPIILIEAEASLPNGAWSLQNEEVGFSGTGYLRWTGPNLYKAPDQTGVLTYKVTLPERGKYVIALRTMRVKNGRDMRHDLENDVWLRVDNTKWVKLYFNHGWDNWGWASRFDLAHYTGLRPISEMRLSAGDVELQIAGRSENVRFDQIAIIPVTSTAEDTLKSLEGQKTRG